MTPRYTIGLDFGTNSCRSLLINIADGSEIGSAVYNYPSGEMGVLTDPRDPNVARQNPQDQLDGLKFIIVEALRQAQATLPDFQADQVVGIGVDTTGSTPIFVDEQAQPLGLRPEFKHQLNAMIWLWKDHTSHAEALEISELGNAIRPHIMAKCGGAYSSEWFWSKILHLKRSDPTLFQHVYSVVENCDWIPAVLAGVKHPSEIRRSICTAGHKTMFSKEWNGLPDKEFLSQLDPALAELRDRLFEEAYTSDQLAGTLCSEWANCLGLPEGIAICIGALDCHMGAVGSGIKPGSLVKIIGTSTCDIMMAPNTEPLADIPGVCGIVDGSVIDGFYGIEAGQSAVGDIFLWYVNQFVPESYGSTQNEKFANMGKAMSAMKPGASGLLALDWCNGNRTVLVDPRLSGLLIGQTLHTKPHEVYRAWIEATAFGALTIINRIEAYNVPIDEVINTGGLSIKNETMMQIYADVINRPMKVSRSEQTCALGAAIFAAAAAGVDTVQNLQERCTAIREKVYYPIPENVAIYRELYQLYLDLHDSFGKADHVSSLAHVMKRLIEIRSQQRSA